MTKVINKTKFQILNQQRQFKHTVSVTLSYCESEVIRIKVTEDYTLNRVRNPNIAGLVLCPNNSTLKKYAVVTKGNRIKFFDSGDIATKLIRHYSMIKECETFDDIITLIGMIE